MSSYLGICAYSKIIEKKKIFPNQLALNFPLHAAAITGDCIQTIALWTGNSWPSQIRVKSLYCLLFSNPSKTPLFIMSICELVAVHHHGIDIVVIWMLDTWRFVSDIKYFSLRCVWWEKVLTCSYLSSKTSLYVWESLGNVHIDRTFESYTKREGFQTS